MGHPVVTNGTPYAFEPLHLLDQDGRPVLAVIIKGTFTILPGSPCRLADEQVPVNFSGEPFAEDPAISSFKYEPEVAFFKPATDVVMNAHAWAPRRDTTEMMVGLRVGPVRKQLRVTGDRTWYRAMGKVGATKPLPFEKIPLTYERAYGGWDRSHPDPKRHTYEPANPSGVGHRSSGIFEELLRLPNLEPHDRPLQHFGDRTEPTAFGFICPNWQPRAALAGTYDQHWEKERAPLLPKDFDRRHLNAASPGLIAPEYLRGDEPVTVMGASPRGTMSFTLPGVWPPEVRVALTNGPEQQLTTNLDTVIVEPDDMQVLLFWRAHAVLRTGPHDVAEIKVSGTPDRR